jgi:hypothetical protein
MFHKANTAVIGGRERTAVVMLLLEVADDSSYPRSIKTRGASQDREWSQGWLQKQLTKYSHGIADNGRLLDHTQGSLYQELLQRTRTNNFCR